MTHIRKTGGVDIWQKGRDRRRRHPMASRGRGLEDERNQRFYEYEHIPWNTWQVSFWSTKYILVTKEKAIWTWLNLQVSNGRKWWLGRGILVSEDMQFWSSSQDNVDAKTFLQKSSSAIQAWKYYFFLLFPFHSLHTLFMYLFNYFR